MTSKIPFIRPRLPEAEILAKDFDEISSSNWYTNFGPKEQKFRAMISAYLGGEVETVTTANATIGLMAAIAAFLPRGNGTEHIAVASFTFAAGAHAIVSHGYLPAWIDVDADSLQPTPESFLRLSQAGVPVRAILLTNSFGIGTRFIEEWEQLSAQLGLPLIIDSAAGFGSHYSNGELLGSRGSCEVFSFHATKPFAIGEGGAVTTKDKEAALRIREYTNFGFGDRAVGAAHAGSNGKLQEINAAIGIRQLEAFENVLEERRSILGKYRTRLDELACQLPEGLENSSVGFVPVVLSNAGLRELVLIAAASAKVEIRSYYAPPVHMQPYFDGLAPMVPLPNTTSLARRMISLPVLQGMTGEEIKRVTEVVRSS